MYYGEDDERLGKTICSLRGTETANNRSEKIKSWIVGLYLTPVALAMLLMIVMLVMTFYRVRTYRHDQSGVGTIIRKTVVNMSSYPLAIVIGWLPQVVSFLVAEYGYGTHPSDNLYYESIYLPTRTTYVWAILNGFFISMLFFYLSVEARERWGRLLSSYFCNSEDQDKAVRVSVEIESEYVNVRGLRCLDMFMFRGILLYTVLLSSYFISSGALGSPNLSSCPIITNNDIIAPSY